MTNLRGVGKLVPPQTFGKLPVQIAADASGFVPKIEPCSQVWIEVNEPHMHDAA